MKRKNEEEQVTQTHTYYQTHQKYQKKWRLQKNIFKKNFCIHTKSLSSFQHEHIEMVRKEATHMKLRE